MQDDAFIAAVLAAPHDDAVRLVYADWLEEHGDPDRAHFIRLQIEIASRAPFDPAVAEMEEEADALRRGREVTWGAPACPERYLDWHFVRGFPEMVEVLAERLVA